MNSIELEIADEVRRAIDYRDDSICLETNGHEPASTKTVMMYTEPSERRISRIELINDLVYPAADNILSMKDRPECCFIKVRRTANKVYGTLDWEVMVGDASCRHALVIAEIERKEDAIAELLRLRNKLVEEEKNIGIKMATLIDEKSCLLNELGEL